MHEGPAPETFTDVSLRGILTNLLDGFTADAKQRNVDVYFEAGDAPMTVRCDKASVTDMLSLLLKHCLKATQSGGWISIRIADDGKNIVLVISDNGIGIPSERLDTVFEPFGQAFPLLKNRTGDVLGLSRVKDVVDLHRGFITVESRHGEGSEFTIILPKDPRTPTGPSQ